jgi:predicted component of viral defense system (DUF524 family)
MEYKKIENILNEETWEITNEHDDGRRNSLDSEDSIIKKINKLLSLEKTKQFNRESNDLYIFNGEDIKIVEPGNFTNTVSFLKMSKMLNLSGNNYNSVCNSYQEKKKKNEIKLHHDYTILYLNKKTKKFKIVLLTELPKECVTVNPSNGIQTKIPEYLVKRTEEEKFELVHNLFVEYINKRINIPSENWKRAFNGK